MKTTLFLLLTLMLGLTASVALVADSDTKDDDEQYEKHAIEQTGDSSWLLRLFGNAEAAAPSAWQRDPSFNAYQSECGDCHMAYPPDMLPKQSWRNLMTGLDDHFGDNAELDAATAAEISDFLKRHANGRMKGSKGSKGSKWLSGMRMPAQTASRITETPWFRAQHHEIPARMVQNNPDIRSYSRCDACHANAASGSFNEHDVRIPGYGRWDD